MAIADDLLHSIDDLSFNYTHVFAQFHPLTSFSEALATSHLYIVLILTRWWPPAAFLRKKIITLPGHQKCPGFARRGKRFVSADYGVEGTVLR